MLWVATRAARPLALTSARKRAEHVVGGLRVEVAGRLVGQQHPGAVGDRAGDGDSLLFAAGQFRRAMALALSETEIGEQFARAGRGLSAREPRDHLRQDEILERRELRQQVMELVDEADVACASAPSARSSLMVEVAAPPILTSPASGRSSRPARCRSVDFPAPDGAISATDWPRR